jgi:hypothetical protein
VKESILLCEEIKDDMVDWVGYAIGILGFLLALFSYLKGKKEKSPCYSTYSRNIIREYISSIENLEIKYSGQKIENLTISKIAFWNAGKEIINWDDIVESAPLSIHSKNGYEILGKKIIASNESTNKFSLVDMVDKAVINIKFDYIWKNNGFVALVYHTGKSNADIEICGKLKSVDKLKHISRETLEKFFLYSLYLVYFLYFLIWVVLFFILFFLCVEILNLLPIDHIPGIPDDDVILGLSALSSILSMLVTAFLYDKKRAKVREKIANLVSKLPVGLEGVFLESDML